MAGNDNVRKVLFKEKGDENAIQRLGKTGLKVSEIGLGGEWLFS